MTLFARVRCRSCQMTQHSSSSLWKRHHSANNRLRPQHSVNNNNKGNNRRVTISHLVMTNRLIRIWWISTPSLWPKSTRKRSLFRPNFRTSDQMTQLSPKDKQLMWSSDLISSRVKSTLNGDRNNFHFTKQRKLWDKLISWGKMVYDHNYRTSRGHHLRQWRSNWWVRLQHLAHILKCLNWKRIC